MSFISASAILALALRWSLAVQAACSSNLLIDDYSKFASKTNALGQYTGDDGTTTNLKANTASKSIAFTTKSTSYFYTTFNCQAATSNGYNAITFPITGPAGATFMLELQTKTGCSATSYKSYYYTVPTKMTGSPVTVTVPMSSFVGANPNAIASLLWESFSVAGSWTIGTTQFVCSSSTVSSASSAVSSAQSKSSVQTISSSPKSAVVSTTSATSSMAATGCTNLLVDDFVSQSRLTFLFYNALTMPSSDDGTMKAVTGRADTGTSVIVANNHVTLTPANANSYWYTGLGCVKASNTYGGIAMTIKAPAGTVLTVELQTAADCTTTNPVLNDMTSTDLGWTFDGTEKTYSIPFNMYANLDQDHIVSLLLSGTKNAYTLGPIQLYCGTTVSTYTAQTLTPVVEPSTTIASTSGPKAIVIDTFKASGTNNLGFYHGGDDDTMFKISGGKLVVNTNGNSDTTFSTQVTGGGCSNFAANDQSYLHIAFTGSNAFTVAFQQHNTACNDTASPYPGTWDSVEASRYSNTAKTDLYIPLTHFEIDRTKTIGFAVKGFYTTATTTFSKIEIVQTVPSGFLVPSKLSTAPLVFACTRPNSFAFSIDDGSPEFTQTVMKSIKDAGVKVTFFTVGLPLLDTSNNFSTVYKEMYGLGHQIALHSYTHPPMEGLPSLADIDWELNQDIAAVKSTLGLDAPAYFRPPFGTEGARIRQRLASIIPGSKFVAWSVDVEDYLWAQSTTPEKQLDAVKRDIAKGGTIVVCHYLYQTTVDYIPQFIALAKATGKQLMRVDQCLEDPNAPAL